MKSFSLFIFSLFSINFPLLAQSWIRINQLGYPGNSIKTAVLVSKDDIHPESFEIYKSSDDEFVWKGNKITAYGRFACFSSTFRLNFSDFKSEGEYYIKSSGIKSPSFRISDSVYKGTADFLLNYMRQQQCGYNPFLKDSCHTHDGFIVDNPSKENQYINAVGGWHDASDYLQYVTTSATAVYQMLFAYMKYPDSFKDEYDKNGDPGSNGIPDILDEAKWGLDWLVKLNPKYGELYNQVADDRDHAGFRLPDLDSTNYGGPDLERPVYYVTGKPQGICKYKNRTTGVSSAAAKFASAFALGSVILQKYYPGFCKAIKQKAAEAYDFGKTDPGVTQTASCRSPYFYEEDNYVDDMELAAAQLFKISGNSNYLSEAADWGKLEPVTPWMGADTARHYQWYPFVNLGHYLLAEDNDNSISGVFTDYMKKGLKKIYNRGKENPFLIGVPFVWCSNNFVTAALIQCRLYNEVSIDSTYMEMEAALRDWLLGCNIWGTSMIIGLPENGDYPSDPHSAIYLDTHRQISGGLVDGPVYKSIFDRLRGLKIVNGDEYSAFQSDLVVYHDDYGDYSTNEPTMDGTASLTIYFSALEQMGQRK
ncbi:MAG: glycoside hydrolase family 9 protein [Ignavibacteriaceae bacterium]